MNKVLHISDRLQEKKRREQARDHRGRVETLQKVVHCSACQLKCSMCGRNMEGEALPSLDFYLCEICRTEFQDFEEIMAKGEDSSGIFWHNKEWIKLWSSWLDFRRSIVAFRDSKEFEKLTSVDP